MSVTLIARPETVAPQEEVELVDRDPHVGSPVPGDADAARMLRHGVLFGTPVLWLVLAVVVLVAVPSQPGLLLAIIGPAVLAGWYFGTIGALTVFELRNQPRTAPAPYAVRRHHGLIHLRVRPSH